MRVRSIITTSAIILLCICVYVNLTYLPLISQHKAEQQQEAVLVNPPSQKHEPLQPKFETKTFETKINDNDNFKANENKANIEVIHNPLVETVPQTVDVRSIVSARIEVYI
jgi:hypothetical protein